MFIIKDNKVGPAHLKIALSPSYTLAELSTAARDYADHARRHWGADDVVDTELQLSLFIAWLAKREQGKGKGEG